MQYLKLITLSDYVNNKYLHSEITSQIISVAIEVHNYLKWGFQESVYHKAMICEFRRRKINVESERELSIYYKDELIGKRRVDFLIDNKVLVEIKSTSILDNNHLAQAINYLEVFNLEVGMLINFGASSLEYKRVIHPKLFSKNKEKNI